MQFCMWKLKGAGPDVGSSKETWRRSFEWEVWQNITIKWVREADQATHTSLPHCWQEKSRSLNTAVVWTQRENTTKVFNSVHISLDSLVLVSSWQLWPVGCAGGMWGCEERVCRGEGSCAALCPGETVMYCNVFPDILPCCLQTGAAFISMSSQPVSPDSCPWNPRGSYLQKFTGSGADRDSGPTLLLWAALLFNNGSELAAVSADMVIVRAVSVSQVRQSSWSLGWKNIHSILHLNRCVDAIEFSPTKQRKDWCSSRKS